MPLTRRQSYVAVLVFSLFVASFLLASTCSATPTLKRNAKQHQRTIAQQVHQVQFADESVHNTLVLLQSSMQMQRRQSPGSKQQQDTRQGQKSKPLQSQERRIKAAGPDHAIKTASSKAMATTASHGSSHSITHQQDTKRNTIGNSTPKSRSVKLISAYEAIIFSESQIPVFLSHDHQRPQPPRKIKDKRQVKTASSSPSAHLPPSSRASDEFDPKKDQSGMVKVPAKAYSPSNVDTTQEPHHNSGIASKDNETPVSTVPSFSSQACVDRHGKTVASLYHDLSSSSALLLGLLATVIVVLYKANTRQQRDIQALTSVPGPAIFPVHPKSLPESNLE